MARAALLSKPLPFLAVTDCRSATLSTPRALPAISLIVLVLILGGCGSGSSTTTSPSEPSTGGETAPSGQGKKPTAKDRSAPKPQAKPAPHHAAPKETAHFTPPTHHDSGGGVKQFEVKGGDNSIQESGDEASSSEFAEAAATLHAFLDARAARAWKVACEQMSPAVAKQLVSELGSAGGKQADCAEVVASLTAGVPAAALRQAAVADVGALRVEDDHGFIIFRGTGGETFFMPMVREGDHWKVAAIAASLLQ
jgi:hypothetical protein